MPRAYSTARSVASSGSPARTRTTRRSGTWPSGRRSDVTAGTSATTTPRLGEQPELQAKLRALRGGEQRPLPELLGQHDGDDDVVAVTAQARDLAEHGLLRVGSRRPHIEPRSRHR